MNLETLIAHFEEHSFTHLEYEQDGLRVVLKRENETDFAAPLYIGAQQNATDTSGAPTMPAPESGLAAATKAATKLSASRQSASPATGATTEVTAPLIGLIYLTSNPETPPYATVGKTVKKGDTLCLIEAMKQFNEIVAPCDGTILEIRFKNGELVEYGSVLFIIG